MHRLNPTHKVNDEVFMGFFPPTHDYYRDLLENDSFKLFLMSDGTTKEGKDRIAIIIKLKNYGNRWTKANVIIKDTTNF